MTSYSTLRHHDLTHLTPTVLGDYCIVFEDIDIALRYSNHALCDYGGASTSDSNAGGLWVTEVGVFAFRPETISHGLRAEAEGSEERRRTLVLGNYHAATSWATYERLWRPPRRCERLGRLPRRYYERLWRLPRRGLGRHHVHTKWR